jgi:protein-tyrosine phosphatase
MDYNEVLPDIYVGSCPTTSDDIDHLKYRLGVTAVMNLQTDEDLKRLDTPWSKLQARYRREKIKVCRVPVRDFDAEDLRKNLPECVQTLGKLVRDGHTVYVHCTAGVGRSPSVVVTYMAWVQQCDLERAVYHVTSCRQCTPNVDAIRLAGEDLWGK